MTRPPPPRGKPRHTQVVLAAAEASIREDGEVAFSMRQLAERADVAFRTPFNLFGSKDNVLRALLEARLTAQAEALATDRAQLDPVSNLFGIATGSCAAYLSDAELYRPLLQAIGAGVDPSLRDQASALWRSALVACADDDLLAPGVAAHMLARRLQATFATSLLMWAHGLLDDEELEGQARVGVALCIHGRMSPRGQALFDAQVTRLTAA